MLVMKDINEKDEKSHKGNLSLMRIPRRHDFWGMTNDYSRPNLNQKVKMISEDRVWEEP